MFSHILKPQPLELNLGLQDRNIFNQTCCQTSFQSTLGSLSLTAVDFIRGGVVSAVVVAVTDKSCTDASSVAAGELSSRVTRGKRAALLVTVVSTVVRVVTGVAEWHTAPVVTSEVHG